MKPDEMLDAAARAFSWFLYDLDINAREFLFVRTSREDIAQQTFLDFRWRARTSEIVRLPIDALVEALQPLDDAPRLNFIWHTSFCCSTLIAKLLDCPGHNLSLREPMALATLAEAVRSGALADAPLRGQTVEATFRLLSKCDAPASRITVKPSNFANLLIPEATARTQGKSLFLFSDLSSFIVSIVNGGAQYRDFARLLLRTVAQTRRERLPWSAAELEAMSPLQIASLAWYLQIEQMQQDWPGDVRAASLNSDAFLSEPAATLEKLDEFLALGLGSAHIKAAVEGPILTHHAKSPEHRFTPHMRAQHDSEIRKRMGATLDRLVEWSARQFPEISQTAPLPNPLVASPKPLPRN
jgi:hypothetical protein